MVRNILSAFKRFSSRIQSEKPFFPLR
nr:hypothetical protein FTX54_09890 [Alkalicoccus halolimnae]